MLPQKAEAATTCRTLVVPSLVLA